MAERTKSWLLMSDKEALTTNYRTHTQSQPACALGCGARRGVRIKLQGMGLASHIESMGF